ncbi:unnamed protein product [Amoebophrya sp. A120]|nr:unnamed protein product [Amoebophrya sp. A120]|eukprot:GSA120T00005908001.1
MDSLIFTTRERTHPGIDSGGGAFGSSAGALGPARKTNGSDTTRVVPLPPQAGPEELQEELQGSSSSARQALGRPAQEPRRPSDDATKAGAEDLSAMNAARSTFEETLTPSLVEVDHARTENAAGGPPSGGYNQDERANGTGSIISSSASCEVRPGPPSASTLLEDEAGQSRRAAAHNEGPEREPQEREATTSSEMHEDEAPSFHKKAAPVFSHLAASGQLGNSRAVKANPTDKEEVLFAKVLPVGPAREFSPCEDVVVESGRSGENGFTDQHVDDPSCVEQEINASVDQGQKRKATPDLQQLQSTTCTAPALFSRVALVVKLLGAFEYPVQKKRTVVQLAREDEIAAQKYYMQQ